MTAARIQPTPEQSRFVSVRGHRLEFVDIPARGEPAPPLLLLHEGLGSVSAWRDFPARLAAATGRRTVAYSRYGYGRSSPSPAPFKPDFMHDEALNILPELRDKLDIDDPVIVGHSGGASIALIHAGRFDVSAVIAMAPLCFVEECNLDSIRQIREVFYESDLPDKLARHHDDAEATFLGWNDIWLAPEFRDWSIVDYLPGIRCPVLTVLGDDDEYSTPKQIRTIESRALNAAAIEHLQLARCGHSPHRDQPDLLLPRLVEFIEGTTGKQVLAKTQRRQEREEI